MARQSQTTFTFAVTFVAPKGMNIPTARDLIKSALVGTTELDIVSPRDIKVHLTNKEVEYG